MPTQVVSIPCLDGSVRSLELGPLRPTAISQMALGQWFTWDWEFVAIRLDGPDGESNVFCYRERGFRAYRDSTGIDRPFNIWTGEPE